MVLKREVQHDGSVVWKVSTWAMNTMLSVIVIWVIWVTDGTSDSVKALEFKVFPSLLRIQEDFEGLHQWIDEEKNFQAKILAELEMMDRRLVGHEAEDTKRFAIWGAPEIVELHSSGSPPLDDGGRK